MARKVHPLFWITVTYQHCSSVDKLLQSIQLYTNLLSRKANCHCVADVHYDKQPKRRKCDGKVAYHAHIVIGFEKLIGVNPIVEALHCLWLRASCINSTLHVQRYDWDRFDLEYCFNKHEGYTKKIGCPRKLNCKKNKVCVARQDEWSVDRTAWKLVA
jgi:hypothetical protein